MTARATLIALAAILLSACRHAPPPSPFPLGRLTVPEAFIRSGPGTGYPAVHRVEAGAVLRVVERNGDWYRIELPRTGQGWLYREVLEVEGEPPAAPP